MGSQVFGIYLGRGVALAMFTALSFATGAGCGGSSSKFQPTLPDLPPRATRATLAGPLCEGDSCRCGKSPAEAGLPESTAVKRYAIRVGPTENEQWVTIGSTVLYKGVERATECFYVDLRAGEHKVTVRAHGKAGIAARVSISELSKLGGYKTFEFGCGGPGLCTFEQLRSFKASLAKYKRHVHDPCGSTKVRGVKWQTGTMPDRFHPSELYLQFVLDVYNFAPRAPSGDPSCANRF